MERNEWKETEDCLRGHERKHAPTQARRWRRASSLQEEREGNGHQLAGRDMLWLRSDYTDWVKRLPAGGGVEVLVKVLAALLLAKPVDVEQARHQRASRSRVGHAGFDDIAPVRHQAFAGGAHDRVELVAARQRRQVALDRRGQLDALVVLAGGAVMRHQVQHGGNQHGVAGACRGGAHRIHRALLAVRFRSI